MTLLPPTLAIVVLVYLQTFISSTGNTVRCAEQLDDTGRRRNAVDGLPRFIRRAPSSNLLSDDENDGIRLAVPPACGDLAFSRGFTEVNSGVVWSNIKNVVAFGDSYTQVGNDGTGLPAPPSDVFIGKSPSAGGRYANGPTWIEQLITFEDNGNTRNLHSYCISGAVTDKSLWPSRRYADDFPSQLARFYERNVTLDPATTLYVGYFGINDFWSVQSDGDHMTAAGEKAIEYLIDLHNNVGAKNFLWMGVQFAKSSTFSYKAAVWSGLRQMKATLGIDFIFVDTGRFFNTVEEDYTRFGYISPKHCLEGIRDSIEDECEEPERTVYYMGAHPSKQTHYILAKYTLQVIRRCNLAQLPYHSLASYRSSIHDTVGQYIPTHLKGVHLFIGVLVLVLAIFFKPFLYPFTRSARLYISALGPQSRH